MRTRLPVLAAVLLLAACGTIPPAASGPAPGSTTTASESATEQGFQPLKLGEEAGLGCATVTDTCPVRFAVTAIDVGPECVTYGQPAPAGHKTVVLHATITTTVLDKAQAGNARLLFSTLNLKGVTPDGHVYDTKIGHCATRDDQLNRDILPNSVFEGTVDITVPEAVTSIATTSDNAGSWLWPLG